MDKETCQDRILKNAVSGFIVGVIGGVVYIGAKLMWKVPYIGLQACACTALYSTIDCALCSVRGKDDFANVVLSGATTGAIIGATRGQSLVINAALGAVIAGVLDGGIQRFENYKE